MICMRQDTLSYKLFSITLAFVLSVWMPVACASDYRPSEIDYYLAPDYCKARFSQKDIKSPADSWTRYPESGIKKWASRIGPVWRHMHHYCLGKAVLTRLQTQRSTSLRGKDIHDEYRRAVDLIEYTWSKASPGSPLWDEMSIDYARALEGTGEIDKSVNVLVDLQKASPKHVAVYVALAKTLKRAGKITDAIATLETAPADMKPTGPIEFYLAHFYFDVGDTEKSRHYLVLAEHSGMKMASLKKQLDLKEQQLLPRKE